ncbi:MAG: 50S ribosomal protein L1 [Nanoarchaeota archaeon]
MAEKEAKEEKIIKTKEKAQTLKAQFLEKIKEIKSTSKPRKFTQSWDLSIAMKGLDLKKPENRFNVEFPLPEASNKKAKIVLFADVLAKDGKDHVDLVITKNEIEKMAGNKKKIKKIANDYDTFLGEVSLMPIIGKNFGAILGPRGKVTRPVPPNVKIDAFINALGKNVRLTLRDTPVIHVSLGNEEMEDEKTATNAEAVTNFVKGKLPKGANNIKAVYIKLTMGKPGKILIQ